MLAAEGALRILVRARGASKCRLVGGGFHLLLLPELPIAVLTFGFALLVSFSLTPVVIRVSWRLLALDRPNTRKVHASPVPRLGGIAVFTGFAAGMGLSIWLTGYSTSLLGTVRYNWIGWVGAIAALFLCGLVDDLRVLGAGVKLLVQIAGGIGVYAAGFRIESVPIPGDGVLTLGAFALPVTLLWIVAVTNAINLIDGLDGLASGIGLLITVTIMAISYHGGVFPVTVVSLALAGSLLGFLPYNFNPARIFLGDSGSQFLGFTLAVISMRGLPKSAAAVAILAPMLILGVPILDTFLVVLRRTWRIHKAAPGRGLRDRITSSRGVFEADREHIHHNLLELGLSHRKAVLVLYCVAAAFCVAAYALIALRDHSLGLILAGVLAVAMTAVKLLAVRHRNGGAVPGPPTVARIIVPEGGTSVVEEAPRAATGTAGDRGGY